LAAAFFFILGVFALMVGVMALIADETIKWSRSESFRTLAIGLVGVLVATAIRIGAPCDQKKEGE
jgi:hypothetical protein